MKKKIVKNKSRRDFLKQTALIGGMTGIAGSAGAAIWQQNTQLLADEAGEFLVIKKKFARQIFEPLQNISLSSSKSGKIDIYDGSGKIYFSDEIDDKLAFEAGGALGYHLIVLKDKKNRIIDGISFKVDCKTKLEDKGREFSKMLDMLFFSMTKHKTPGFYRMDGDVHYTYAGWFQDHVHVFKAMKYFHEEVKTGFDLWAKGQREDGMLADNCYLPNKTSWLNRFGKRFVWQLGDEKTSSAWYIRVPVENMSEFTFLEGIYYAWKATGDDQWMAGKLDNCLKAVEYSTSDEYRWSKKFKLLKRGYTIDIWDFQPPQDLTPFEGDIMMAKPGITKYSIMYGDNVGFAVGCQYLSEMLEYVGRKQEADKITKLGNDIMERLNKLSWNGNFYTHHIPEDPSYKRDFGNTDESKQVTISNSYAVNRRIGHEKAKAIIKTYQKIKKEMPESSPGEWYMCYPPYNKGWHIDKWEYMNGGVSGIVAGELAHGAFEHGFEDYAVDILRRTWNMAQLTNNYLYCIYRGSMPEYPSDVNFTPVSLKQIANADTSGKGAKGVPGWTGEGENDLHEFPSGKKYFEHVPFELVDPAKNGRRACLILSGDKGYALHKQLPVNKKAASFYLLHAQSWGNNIGNITLNYEDGSKHVIYVNRGENVAGWWYPSDKYHAGKYSYKVVWRGKNAKCIDVGIYMTGFNNPHKEKTIKSIDFNGIESHAKWMILGISLSDREAFFMPKPQSYGAPDNWSAAAVIYALMEGLAGIKNTGIAFKKAELSPRWETAGVEQVSATAKYEASGGYLSYRYKKQGNTYSVKFTGNAEEMDVKLIIPNGKTLKEIRVNGQPQNNETEQIEQSRYAKIKIKGTGIYHVEMETV